VRARCCCSDCSVQTSSVVGNAVLLCQERAYMAVYNLVTVLYLIPIHSTERDVLTVLHTASTTIASELDVFWATYGSHDK
jgi:hypothetical protein